MARRRAQRSAGGGAPNPALVVSDDGEDILAALEGAGFAAERAPGVAEAGGAGGAGWRAVATPPLVVLDLRGEGVRPDAVRRLRAEAGRLPIVAVADEPAAARAAVEAGANESVGTAELARELPELANVLLRMATLW